MKREYYFTKSKFLSFPLRQQHKKCAEFLRRLYDCLLVNQPVDALIAHYNEIQEWILSPKLSTISLKVIADRYHEHLKTADICIRENNLLPPIRTGDRKLAKDLLPIAIYLDKIRSAFNVGSILRTAEAFALGSIYFSDGMPFIDNRQVQNTSMDACHWIPCYQGINLEKLPRPVIVMETSPIAISIHEFIFPETFTLVMGNEEYGCSDDSLRLADYIVEVPLRGRKNSLNVANAFAIAASEIQRQHHKGINEPIS